jgi:hypothetical protein
MADETLTVNDLVTQHAAKSKETTEVKTPEANKETTTTDTGATTDAKKDDTPAPDPVKDLLKEFNLESLEALKERLKPQDASKVESPEEKEKRENLYRVEMQKYAVENGLMKPDEFVKLEMLKAKDNRSLVYENWLTDWKADNPDIDPADVEERSKEDFETEYHLNSTNEKTKARGLAKIEKEAKEMRIPLESSYTKVKQDFDEDRAVANDYPDYSKKVSGFIQENIPAKVKLFETKDGEESVPVEIDLTDDQRKEIYQKVAKRIMNSGTYQLYKKNDVTQLQAIAKREAEAEIWAGQREVGLQKIAETFLKRGDEKGYKRGSVGAKNPFPLVKDGSGQGGGTDKGSAQQQVLDSLQGKK